MRIIAYEKLHLHHWEEIRKKAGSCYSRSSSSEKVLTGESIPVKQGNRSVFNPIRKPVSFRSQY